MPKFNQPMEPQKIYVRYSKEKELVDLLKSLFKDQYSIDVCNPDSEFQFPLINMIFLGPRPILDSDSAKGTQAHRGEL